MEQIMNLVNWFKNISQEQIVDLIFGIIIAVIFYGISSFLIFLVIKLTKKSKKLKVKDAILYTPIKIFAKVFSIYLGLYVVQLPEVVMTVVDKVMKIIAIWLIADCFARLCTPKSFILKKIGDSNKFSKVDNNMLKFIAKIIKGIIYIIAVFIIMKELNYDLTGLIAGFGLSSVVVALAAQDLAKNLIAGAGILLDKSYKIGDWLQVGTSEGTVENISIKSTKLRALDDSIIIIPNSVMVGTSVINWSNLKKRRYSFDLKLPLNTSGNVIERIKKRISFVLTSSENVIENSVQVNLTNIDLDSLKISIYLYTDIIPFDDYLVFKTKINMMVLKILEEEQIKLAYPGQDIYIKSNN